MNNPHVGSSFDDFLAEDAMLDEVTAVAVKRVISLADRAGDGRLESDQDSLAKKMHATR